MTETATAPLTGKALLAKVKELSNLPRRERAKQCGYYTVTKNNQVRVNLTDFYDALLSARGIPLSPEAPKDGRGREPTYRVSVHQNGQIVIGATYTKAMGLKHGDEFEIKLGYKHIHLIQVDSDKKELQSDVDIDEEEDEIEEEE
ncbi:AbrB family transcriptional regulator [Fischerella muscicola CCMEE 5323]|uniref:AbrB family transcriptional regulator n=1 Tax=Fischerella muscicola CCMEE 5323 TaxID=2019572 RepID=A0A2N6K1L9_FISMU|nr:AbrB family transcriptional regulator [Fischerella muscicola]PLZ88590.1 AbrB family transcriptional regulator [Fischerella muscicola CCMEE 5323]